MFSHCEDGNENLRALYGNFQHADLVSVLLHVWLSMLLPLGMESLRFTRFSFHMFTAGSYKYDELVLIFYPATLRNLLISSRKVFWLLLLLL